MDLGSNAFMVDGAKAVGEYCRQCMQLRTLNLSNTPLGPPGIRRVVGDLGLWSSLRSLILVGMKLRDDGAVSVAGQLSVCCMLELLDLQSNQIGDPAAEVLAFSVPECDSLVELHLDHNEITDIGAMELMSMAQASDSLKVLSFHHTNRLTEKIIEAVGKLGCTGALGKAGESMQMVGMNTSEASSTPPKKFGDQLKPALAEATSKSLLR